MQLEMNNTVATIHNVVGVIEGALEPDRYGLAFGFEPLGLEMSPLLARDLRALS